MTNLNGGFPVMIHSISVDGFMITSKKLWLNFFRQLNNQRNYRPCIIIYHLRVTEMLNM